MMKPTPFDPATYLKAPEAQAEYIAAAYETGEPEEINRALLMVQRARLTHDALTDEQRREQIGLAQKMIAAVNAGAQSMGDACTTTGVEYEFPLPAGAEVMICGRPHHTQAPVVVRSAHPATILEGRNPVGSEAQAQWPSGITFRYVLAVPDPYRHICRVEPDMETLEQASAAMKRPPG